MAAREEQSEDYRFEKKRPEKLSIMCRHMRKIISESVMHDYCVLSNECLELFSSDEDDEEIVAQSEDNIDNDDNMSEFESNDVPIISDSNNFLNFDSNDDFESDSNTNVSVDFIPAVQTTENDTLNLNIVDGLNWNTDSDNDYQEMNRENDVVTEISNSGSINYSHEIHNSENSIQCNQTSLHIDTAQNLNIDAIPMMIENVHASMNANEIDELMQAVQTTENNTLNLNVDGLKSNTDCDNDDQEMNRENDVATEILNSAAVNDSHKIHNSDNAIQCNQTSLCYDTAQNLNIDAIPMIENVNASMHTNETASEIIDELLSLIQTTEIDTINLNIGSTSESDMTLQQQQHPEINGEYDTSSSSNIVATEVLNSEAVNEIHNSENSIHCNQTSSHIDTAQSLNIEAISSIENVNTSMHPNVNASEQIENIELNLPTEVNLLDITSELAQFLTEFSNLTDDTCLETNSAPNNFNEFELNSNKSSNTLASNRTNQVTQILENLETDASEIDDSFLDFLLQNEINTGNNTVPEKTTKDWPWYLGLKNKNHSHNNTTKDAGILNKANCERDMNEQNNEISQNLRRTTRLLTTITARTNQSNRPIRKCRLKSQLHSASEESENDVCWKPKKIRNRRSTVQDVSTNSFEYFKRTLKKNTENKTKHTHTQKTVKMKKRRETVQAPTTTNIVRAVEGFYDDTNKTAKIRIRSHKNVNNNHESSSFESRIVKGSFNDADRTVKLKIRCPYKNDRDAIQMIENKKTSEIDSNLVNENEQNESIVDANTEILQNESNGEIQITENNQQNSSKSIENETHELSVENTESLDNNLSVNLAVTQDSENVDNHKKHIKQYFNKRKSTQKLNENLIENKKSLNFDAKLVNTKNPVTSFMITDKLKSQNFINYKIPKLDRNAHQTQPKIDKTNEKNSDISHPNVNNKKLTFEFKCFEKSSIQPIEKPKSITYNGCKNRNTNTNNKVCFHFVY